MKVKKNITLLFLILFTIIFHNKVNASTSTPVFGGRYTRGITKISWWMDYSNGGGWYEYQIINATNNWQNPGWPNPILFVPSSSNSGTMMDIYTKTTSFWEDLGPSAQYILAETRFYNSSGVQQNPYTNYVFTRIYLNDTTMHNLSISNMRGTIAHEIGHTLGLAHNNTNVNSIMCQTAYGRVVQTVQAIDNTAVVNLYQ